MTKKKFISELINIELTIETKEKVSRFDFMIF